MTPATAAGTVASAGAVIFDLDGTLVDSEAVALPACVEALAAVGFQIDAATFARRFTGRTDEAIIAILIREQGVDVDPAHALAEVQRLALARLADAVEAMPGALELVAAIAVPRAVASNSAPARIRLCLERTGLVEHFMPHLYSAEHVAEGKPAPDLFLFTAERLGVAPTACVVVEDSAHGVRAAKAAGMTAIGLTAAYAPDHEEVLRAAGADHVVPALAALHALLAR